MRSVGRCVRVVYEIEKRSAGRRCISARTSEVLPAPDGAAITNSLPRFLAHYSTF